MRYFEIVKPSARHISADAEHERQLLRDERRQVGSDMKPLERQPYCISLGPVRPNQSAVTSTAFITPAFAIAQGSVCPRN